MDGNSAAGSAESTGSETKLIRAVHSVYKRWAHFIVDNVVSVITVCTLLTIVCTIKIRLTRQKNDITGYTPYGARSLEELAIRNEFFDQNGVGVALVVLAEPRTGSNILKLEYLEEMVKIDEIIRKNFTLYNHFKKRNQTFDEFCSDYCKLNDPLRSYYLLQSFLQRRVISTKERCN